MSEIEIKLPLDLINAMARFRDEHSDITREICKEMLTDELLKLIRTNNLYKNLLENTNDLCREAWENALNEFENSEDLDEYLESSEIYPENYPKRYFEQFEKFALKDQPNVWNDSPSVPVQKLIWRAQVLISGFTYIETVECETKRKALQHVRRNKEKAQTIIKDIYKKLESVGNRDGLHCSPEAFRVKHGVYNIEVYSIGFFDTGLYESEKEQIKNLIINDIETKLQDAGLANFRASNVTAKIVDSKEIFAC